MMDQHTVLLSYTMTISVNAAPNVTDTTISGTVAAGAQHQAQIYIL